MKRPMTTAELFNKICSVLKEKNKMPEILDYGLAAHTAVPIKTYEFDLKTNLTYGGNEGIYLGLRIEYYTGNEWCVHDLGTFKTLLESDEAMHIMAALLADFVIEQYAYVNAKLDDFTWEGADVHPLDETGKCLGWGYSCSNMDSALKRKDELLKKYPQVAVRDNATRKENVFQKAGIQKKGDKYVSNERFTVSAISFNDSREIVSLEITDSHGQIVYTLQQSGSCQQEGDRQKTKQKEDKVTQNIRQGKSPRQEPQTGKQRTEPMYAQKERTNSDSKPGGSVEGSISGTQEIVLMAELNRTGVTLDEVLKRYKLGDISQMTPEIYHWALAALRQTKPKGRATKTA